MARSVLPGCFPHQTFSPGSGARSTRVSFAEHLQEAYGTTCTAPPACTEITEEHAQVRHLQTNTFILKENTMICPLVPKPFWHGSY